MPVSKTRKYARKTAKLYRMVTFTSEIFEGDFVFPDIAQLSLGTLEALNKGDVGKICAWLTETNVDPESIEAFLTLSQEELMGFIDDWTGANLATLPK